MALRKLDINVSQYGQNLELPDNLQSVYHT
jgi:hypothetical protein